MWPPYQTCERKVYVLVEVQRLQQSDNLEIAMHDRGVKQCSKVVASLKKIPQINVQKVRVFCYESKVQSVYFKDKSKLPSHHNEKLFFGKVPIIEMKNMVVGSMENLQKSIDLFSSLYVISDSTAM